MFLNLPRLAGGFFKLFEHLLRFIDTVSIAL